MSKNKAAKPEETEAKPPAEEEDGYQQGASVLEDMLADLDEDSLAFFEAALDGKTVIGPNVACNGFFKKSSGCELAGVVVQRVTRPNQINGDNTDEILFVRGGVHVPADVKNRDGSKTVIAKGRYQGVFGFQLDAGTVALSGAHKGSKVHIKVDKLADLSGGRTRWTYAFVRCA